MKNKILLIPFIFLSVSSLAFPNGWVLSIFNQSYTDLSNPTLLPLSTGWDDPDEKMPLGFTHTALGQTTDTMYTGLSHGGVLSTSKAIGFNAYTIGIDVIDRALSGLPGVSSTISYNTTGTTGNRITKIQWKNFGFKGEYLTDFTLNDSGNVQVWFYESDNSVEYRFGPASVTDLARNVQGPNLQMGILLSNLSPPWLYYVDSLNPAILDSTTNAQLNTGQYGVPNYPANGTVIRFGPAAVGVNDIVHLNNELSFYPSLATDKINLDFTNEVKDNCSLQILNLNGRIVAQQNIYNKRNSINISHLPSANYLLHIRQNRQTIFYRFTKN